MNINSTVFHRSSNKVLYCVSLREMKNEEPVVVTEVLSAVILDSGYLIEQLMYLSD